MKLVHSKMEKNKEHHTFETVKKKLVENRVNRGKINTANTYLHDRSHSWLGANTSIKRWQG